MNDEEIAEKKINRIAGVKDISEAIKKLERKKELMENELKDQANYFLENLHPVRVLDHALQNVKRSSTSKYSLFKEALAFGAGYISKREVIRQLKNALKITFRIHANAAVTAIVKGNEDEKSEFKQIEENSKEMNKQNQIEKVKAKPEVLPEPTYWPFFLAMGLSFLGWGLLTTWLISLAGFIILIIALIGWINILRHE